MTTPIPPARGHLPKGTSREKAIAHSRVAKNVETAKALYTRFGDDANPELVARLTDEDYRTAARTAGVNPPTSEESRTQVRLLLSVLVSLSQPDFPLLERAAAVRKALTRGGPRDDGSETGLVGIVAILRDPGTQR
ncbi:hypothetical protein [Streptomyces sp. NPDC001404]|uniref:hypothetical protein n=1 Tax=Streptomyces sp. NPDC001404 TaxID=3364571 RepID=UPI0036BDC31E